MTEYKIGDVVWVSVNGGKGLSVMQLLARHDEDGQWVADMYPGTKFLGLIVINEKDIAPSPDFDDEPDYPEGFDPDTCLPGGDEEPAEVPRAPGIDDEPPF